MTSPAQPRRRGKVLLALAMAAAAAAILLLLLYRERDLLLTHDWHLRPAYIVGGCALMVVGLGLAALIWADLMAALGSRVRRGQHVRYYCIAHLARRLPGTLWYVAGRGYFYRPHGDSLRLVALASGVELIVSVVSGALVTLCLAGALWTQVPRGAWAALVAAAAVGLGITHPAAIGRLLAAMGLTEAPRLRYELILRWLAGYVLLWLLGGLVFFLIAGAVVPVGVEELPFIVASWCLIGTLSVVVFFLPSNLGFTEVGLSLLLTALMPSSLAVLVAVLSRLLMMGYELVGAGLIVGLTHWGERPQRRRGA